MAFFLWFFTIYAISWVPIKAERLLITAEDIARKCCSNNEISCCADAIKNRSQITCHNMNRNHLRESTECLQQEIFGKNVSSKISVKDLKCCQVFIRNDNDPENKCTSLCSDTILTVGMESDEKIRRIQNCENGKSLFKCFETCLEMARKSMKFSFRRHCSWRDRMVPGQLYIGDVLNFK